MILTQKAIINGFILKYSMGRKIIEFDFKFVILLKINPCLAMASNRWFSLREIIVGIESDGCVVAIEFNIKRIYS